jgi:hypothetical protein
MNKSDTALTRTVCGVKLDNGKRCQNPVKTGKGPCWRHADGFWAKVRSFARNETKKFILGTAISFAGVVAALYGGSQIKIAWTNGPNSPAVSGNGTVINYGAPPPPRPWVAIKDPALTNTVELSDRGLDAWVRLPLENTTETPAVAAVGASLFFATERRSKAGIEMAEDDLCKSIQDRMESGKIFTSTVFRGTEQYPMTTGVHADRKEVDEAIRLATSNWTLPGSEPVIAPVVISCVVYRAAAGKEYYDSAYANHIARFVCIKPTDTVCNTGLMFAKKRKYNAFELAFPPWLESPARAK